MKQTLKSEIQFFYAEQQLTNKQQCQLQHLMNGLDGKQTSIDPPLKYTRMSIIGGTCFALLLFFMLLPNSANIQDIASEVAGNHRHLKPLSIKSNSYRQVDHFFSELNFSVTPSPRLDSSRWQLLGGRYCSINGVKAAQLRLLDTHTNTIQSFYQNKYKTGYFESVPDIGKGQLPLSVTIEGISVEVWSEGGILYTLTHTPKK